MSKGRTLRILIADDHAILRKGLKQILSDMPDTITVDEAKDGEEVLVTYQLLQHEPGSQPGQVCASRQAQADAESAAYVRWRSRQAHQDKIAQAM